MKDVIVFVIGKGRIKIRIQRKIGMIVFVFWKGGKIEGKGENKKMWLLCHCEKYETKKERRGKM